MQCRLSKTGKTHTIESEEEHHDTFVPVRGLPCLAAKEAWKTHTTIECCCCCCREIRCCLRHLLIAHCLWLTRCSVLRQDLLRANADAYAEAVARAGGAVEVAELTWGQPQLPAGWERPDIVLAADLVYHRSLYQPLLTTLAQFGERPMVDPLSSFACVQLLLHASCDAVCCHALLELGSCAS